MRRSEVVDRTIAQYKASRIMLAALELVQARMVSDTPTPTWSDLQEVSQAIKAAREAGFAAHNEPADDRPLAAQLQGKPLTASDM